MTPQDLEHLRLCIQLATKARDNGDHPFGSALVSRNGDILATRINEVNTRHDVTAHPEIALASWASQNLTSDERASATVYTSGEHCAMCAAAHVWAGIGRLVFVLSCETINELVGPEETLFHLTAREVIGRSNIRVVVEGPCAALEDEVRRLFDGPLRA